MSSGNEPQSTTPSTEPQDSPAARVEWRRILAALGWVALALACVLPILSGRGDNWFQTVFLGATIWGGLAVVVAEALARRPGKARPIDPEQATIRLRFRGGRPALVLRAYFVTLCLLALAPALAAGARIALQIGLPKGLIVTSFLWIAAGAVVVVLGFVLASGMAFVAEIQCDAATLRLQVGMRKRSFPLSGIRWRRVLSPTGVFDGLEIEVVETGESIRLPVHRPRPPDLTNMEGLAHWLGARGCDVGVHRRALENNAVRGIAWALVEIAVWLACIFLTACLCVAGLFWWDWLTLGTLDLVRYVEAGIPASLLAGLLVSFSPLRGWIWKLIRAGEFKRPCDAKEMEVDVVDAAGRGGFWLSGSRTGCVRLEGNDLTVETGSLRIRISRERIRAIRRWGMWRTMERLHRDRWVGRAVEVAWDDDDGVRRALAMISRDGASFRKDRRLERAMFAELAAWWRQERATPTKEKGENENGFESESDGEMESRSRSESGEGNGDGSEFPTGFAALNRGHLTLTAGVAGLFLAFGIAAPLLHNHLLMTRVRTGVWRPPAWIRPQGDLLSSRFGLEAVCAGWIPMQEASAGMAPTTSAIGLRAWRVDAIEDFAQVVSFPLVPSAVSFPGPPSHALRWDTGLYLSAALIPPTSWPGTGQFPAQVVSFATGRAIDVPAYPVDRLPLENALYRDERIFFVQTVDTRTSEVTVMRPAANASGGAGNAPGPPGAGPPFMDPEIMGVTDPELLMLMRSVEHEAATAAAGADRTDAGADTTTESLALVPVRETRTIPISEPAWIDVKSGVLSRLPQMESSGLGSPLFFPGGRYVLYDWMVFDLDEGTRRPVDIPAEAAALKTLGGSPWNAFGTGAAIRMVDQGDHHESRPCRVWEIDPESARMELVKEFSEKTRLVSADGDLWLLAEATTPMGDAILKPYHHATGFYGHPSTISGDACCFLDAGTESILIHIAGEGWRVRRFRWE